MVKIEILHEWKETIDDRNYRFKYIKIDGKDHINLSPIANASEKNVTHFRPILEILKIPVYKSEPGPPLRGSLFIATEYLDSLKSWLNGRIENPKKYSNKYECNYLMALNIIKRIEDEKIIQSGSTVKEGAPISPADDNVIENLCLSAEPLEGDGRTCSSIQEVKNRIDRLEKGVAEEFEKVNGQFGNLGNLFGILRRIETTVKYTATNIEDLTKEVHNMKSRLIIMERSVNQIEAGANKTIPNMLGFIRKETRKNNRLLVHMQEWLQADLDETLDTQTIKEVFRAFDLKVTSDINTTNGRGVAKSSQS